MMDYEKDRVETMMAQWGSWISYYVEGGRGTWPRDAFEALIQYYEDRLVELKFDKDLK